MRGTTPELQRGDDEFDSVRSALVLAVDEGE